MEKDAKNGASKLVMALGENETAPLLSGANAFNGVVWFNKEVIDSSIVNAFALALLDSTDEEAILKQYASVLSAKDAAGYKCEELVKAFAPAKKKSASVKSDSKEKPKAKKSTKK